MSEFRAVDPATGVLIGERPDAGAAEVEAAIARAHAAFHTWSAMPIPERAAGLHRLAARLRDRAATDAITMADEMGKPVTQGKAEVEKCAWTCEFAADKAAEWLASEHVHTEAQTCLIRHEPIGPILAIMPWNFPFWQLFRFGAGALAAGNAIVLKHAPNVPGCAEAIAQACAEARLPEGLVTNLFVRVDQVDGLLGDERIGAVTLTGSTRAGVGVAGVAARHLKPSVLELGGSDAFIVLPDADLDRAAEIASKARLQNNGQSCIAAKRFIVCREVEERFIERFKARMAAVRVGDPREAATELGPMARRDLRDQLHAQVVASVAKGARCVLGGVGPGMPAWDEETFGPVAAVRVVADADEAVEVANASPYGLGAAIWTADRERAADLAARLQVGAVFVNDLVRSDPRLPFGGTRQSGWGRELGREGMRAFTTTKSVWIA
jgi:succinate-semialdehyde dehydrogenase/glutarate-semialdehyde dehydrogenase